jgi:protein-L-isoaspartate(D-aspartate) O-methyltransferase
VDLERARRDMVESQLRPRGIEDPAVLEAMGAVPRHLFVAAGWQKRAYEDSPLPIGPEQTISQPYIVALVCERAALKPGDRVLEIGAGSGYQMAVLLEMGMEVYALEIVPRLRDWAEDNLIRAGYGGFHLRAGDGWAGWPEAAPFRAILMSAASPRLPRHLVDQLAEGGRLLLPLGGLSQDLVCLRRQGKRYHRERLLPVRFVPMKGEAEEEDVT